MRIPSDGITSTARQNRAVPLSPGDVRYTDASAPSRSARLSGVGAAAPCRRRATGQHAARANRQARRLVTIGYLAAGCDRKTRQQMRRPSPPLALACAAPSTAISVPPPLCAAAAIEAAISSCPCTLLRSVSFLTDSLRHRSPRPIVSKGSEAATQADQHGAQEGTAQHACQRHSQVAVAASLPASLAGEVRHEQRVQQLGMQLALVYWLVLRGTSGTSRPQRCTACRCGGNSLGAVVARKTGPDMETPAAPSTAILVVLRSSVQPPPPPPCTANRAAACLHRYTTHDAFMQESQRAIVGGSLQESCSSACRSEGQQGRACGLRGGEASHPM